LVVGGDVGNGDASKGVEGELLTDVQPGRLRGWRGPTPGIESTYLGLLLVVEVINLDLRSPRYIRYSSGLLALSLLGTWV
jgi:hypothetical protein